MNRTATAATEISTSPRTPVIGPYTFDEYIEAAERFHGYAAPGLVVGGFMVDAARKCLPEGILFDAVSETAWCLPDAVQMLTPCTVGNGWLKIMNLGLYAVTLYDKFSGKGFRVALDIGKAGDFPEIRTWLLKSKPKKEQDSKKLRQEIREAGSSICSISPVTVARRQVQRVSKGAVIVCPVCGSAYPQSHGRICRMCQGEGPYLEGINNVPGTAMEKRLELKTIPVDRAVGKQALHDMTQVVPRETKGVAFHKGQMIGVGDVCRLQQLGKFNIYVEEENKPDQDKWMHEDSAAEAFARAMAGPGVTVSDSPREGKMTLVASRPGILVVDREGLEAFNLVPNVMAASRPQYRLVAEGERVAATRAIPLYLDRATFENAMRLLEGTEIFSVLPLRVRKVGVLVTGTEIASGLIQDKFAPIVSNKVKRLGCDEVFTRIVKDDVEEIRQGVGELIASGAELLVTTAGLSVDPDDVTRKGLQEAGATDMLYGAPVLPGAMMLLARIRDVRVIGVPACALFYKTTSFDLLLPRLLAGVGVTRRDLARLAVGGMCMECKTCTYPKCRFGN